MAKHRSICGICFCLSLVFPVIPPEVGCSDGMFLGSKWVFPKIGGNPPKWMVKIMVPNPIKMDDLGGFPHLFGNTQIPPKRPKVFGSL